MPLPLINSYEIETGPLGLKVPVINGIHLHSIYNPEKEAKDLIKENLGMIGQKNAILILGLGFGYHLKELVNFYKTHWGNDFLVAVVEPLDQTVLECEKLNLLPPENVLIFSGMEINDLYANVSFTDFLLKRPGVLPHPPSLNFFDGYFRELLSRKAPKNLKDISEQIKSPEIKKYLSKFSPDLPFDNFLANDLEKKVALDDPHDFLFHALKELKTLDLEQV